MVKFKKTTLSVLSVGLAACFSASIAAMAITSKDQWTGVSSANGDTISRLDGSIDNHAADYFDGNVVSRLSDNISSNQEISVILSLNTQSALDAYLEGGSKGDFPDYLGTSSAKKLVKENRAAGEALRKTLDKAKISYKMGVSYENVISGFEVTLRAKDYYKLVDAVGDKATPIVGEVYAPSLAEIVTNDVDVYETGIFDSSSCDYKGDGVVVAVLDTGLDYTHTAFSTKNFKTTNARFTLENVSEKLSSLGAATTTSNLKAEDVYVSEKVPYAYDYADKDSDVFPLNSEHGTHVAGVIAGKDDTITGVAPNAQLAIMKVFSDSESSAKSSWILAGVDDCVALGVDVINMSLGTAAGFTTQDDKEQIEEIYDKVREAGISLIAAAGNENNAVQGSDKNGSNPLTRNPDSGVVGSPSTYEASLSVASVGGVKTPYFVYNDDIIYFNEASDSTAKPKHFVDDILSTVGADSYDFQYVTISGVGRRSDYTESREYYQNKIVLVKRGDTTFEEKVDIALRIMKAAGIIIYNNVSGSISMAVGSVKGAVCSISQDEGEKLAAAKTGIIKISKSQVAGPFMSDFSSWGPTSDLRIKPEITAHGGEILSAIPGQAYDRMSGTSMAAPNMAGAAALIRQYVRYSGVFGSYPDVLSKEQAQEVTKRVNQLAMSTADIVRNKNGLAYAVRKQGAGLVSIGKATTAEAYISTFSKNGEEMDKSKLELGDDKNKTGVYTMTFAINNVTKSSVSYNIGSIVMTEGVSSTLTSHNDTTVTTDGYLLSPTTSIVKVEGDGSSSGSVVTVDPNKSVKVTVKITLSDADKTYLNDSFEHGMYVEGFITMSATNGTKVNLNVPFLAFYGDWTEAPIFDEEYYDTNADEINNGIDPEDKLMPDAYATRVIGGYYSDYIAPLGAYPFVQDPSATQIAASKDHIALSNYENGESSSLNKINSIAAGLLRNVKEWKLTIVEDATGKEIWSKEGRNQRKSISSGNTIYQSSMEVNFSVLEHNLKNNTKYTVTVETYIDGDKAEQKNARSTFSFPLYIDFEAPIVTGVDFRTEYDQSTKQTHLYADVNIYDNHYAMGVMFGQIVASTEPNYVYSLTSFGKYVTPVYSSYNSTSKVTVELTDYVKLIKNNSIGLGTNGPVSNNSFVATCYDYAMNAATYEIRLPDEVLAMYFKEAEIKLNPNETLDLTTVLDVFPADTWLQVLDFESDNEAVVGVVNQTAIAKPMGAGQTATITATGKDANGKTIKKSIKIYVRSKKNDPDEYREYDAPLVNKASISKYHTEKAYYEVSSSEREIGLTDNTYSFGKDYTLSMFPSESVTLICDIDTYFPEYGTKLKFTSSRSDIVSVNENGTILANAKGSALINVNVEITDYSGKATNYFVGAVDVTVKDPFTTNSIYLMSYKGNGGKVVIPDDRGITTIQSYAFSNYEYVEKGADDVIDEEDPYHIKQMYIGENTITEIVIPEGVTTIESYAFAKLSKLKKVTLPSTLVRIGVGAFFECKQLQDVNFENVKFINEHAFDSCNIAGTPKFNSIVAIGSYAFNKNKIAMLNLPKSAQSLDKGAFQGNANLDTVNFAADQIKIGEEVFSGCTKLKNVTINAAVISDKAFFECSNLEEITLGKEVAVIGQNAFGKTKVSKFNIEEGNATFEVSSDGRRIYKKVVVEEEDGTTKVNKVLVLIAPFYGETSIDLGDATKVESGAFAGNAYIQHVSGSYITEIGSYAFANCINLLDFSFPNLTTIGDYAFYNAEKLTINSTAGDSQNDQLKGVTSIGSNAFAGTAIEEVNIADHTEIGDFAFYWCLSLKKVKIGDGVTIGMAAFLNPVHEYTFADTESLSHYTRYDYPVGDTNYTYYRYKFLEDAVRSNMISLEIGENVKIGANAFRNNAKLESVTLGEGAEIGAYAFYDVTSLTSIDLSKATVIGVGAFSGTREVDLYRPRPTTDPYVYAPALEYETDEEGRVFITGWYKTSDFAPSIITANLSSATKVGEGAFAFNQSLTEVTLNAGLEEIEAYAFAHCKSLAKVNYDTNSETCVLPENVTKIGDYAFMNTKVVFKDLEKVTAIGNYAFAHTLVKEIVLNENGTAIGDNAFYACEQLTSVDNMGSVTEIGESAFALTALEKVDLTSAKKVGDFAFGGSNVKEVTFGKELKTVEGKETKTLGSSLKEIGENPFYGCEIESFSLSEEVYYEIEGTEEKVLVGTKTVDTYDVSDTVKVIGNVLYAVVPNGLELVCYPVGAGDSAYTVEEGTVRIGARAFQGSSLVNVTLPRSLKAIGDKAFYDCGLLTTVIFNSYNAPVLEEEYDQYYSFSTDNLAGSYGGNEGLGISNYYMWTATNPTNFYYGANFVYNVGQSSPRLIIVSPANGTGYNSFIFKQYFGTSVLGSNAVTDDTLAVIALIASLNNSISLKDEAAVEEARRAYDALPNLEQKALVTNYTKLTNAESMIIYLKQQGQGKPGPAVEPEPIENSSVNALGIAGFTIAGVLLVALAALAVYTFLEKKKAKAAAAENNFDSSETVSEEGEGAEADEKNDASETENNDNE